jgi:hypothetical protein
MDIGAATVFMTNCAISVHNEADHAARGILIMAG